MNPFPCFFFPFSLCPPLKYDQSCPPEKKDFKKQTKISLSDFKELLDEFF